MADTNFCKCGRTATVLVEYDNGEIEPVCESCNQSKRKSDIDSRAANKETKSIFEKHRSF